MPKIIVTPLSGLEQTIRDHRPSHVVTLLSPEHMIETPAGFEPARHLRLGMNDVGDPALGTDPPTAGHIRTLLEFAQDWDGKAPLVVHCWAGVSRSTAAAFILMCERQSPGRERALASALRLRAPHASPNRLMVRFADAVLNRNGRMVEAVESIGPGTIVTEGVPFSLPLLSRVS